jgi:hypothetical protein
MTTGVSSTVCRMCCGSVAHGANRVQRSCMHERCGLRNSFRRWAEQGVGDAILAMLVALGLTDDWQHMIEAPSFAAIFWRWAEKGFCAGFWSITRWLYVQGPSPLRQSGTSSRLHPDRRRGILPVIPPRSNRREPIPCDFHRYRDRNRIERMLAHFKRFRRVATRYDKTAPSLPAS